MSRKESRSQNKYMKMDGKKKEEVKRIRKEMEEIQ